MHEILPGADEVHIQDDNDEGRTVTLPAIDNEDEVYGKPRMMSIS